MTGTPDNFWALSPDDQWALATKHGVDMSTNPYTTPFETARLMMYRARQAGVLQAMLDDAKGLAP